MRPQVATLSTLQHPNVVRYFQASDTAALVQWGLRLGEARLGVALLLFCWRGEATALMLLCSRQVTLLTCCGESSGVFDGVLGPAAAQFQASDATVGGGVGVERLGVALLLCCGGGGGLSKAC